MSLLSGGNSLAAGGGYLAGAAASTASQSLQCIDGVVQSLNCGLGFLELAFEDGYNVKVWHNGQCSAPSTARGKSRLFKGSRGWKLSFASVAKAG